MQRHKITRDSSHKGLAIGISMEWRELINASDEPSKHISDYSESRTRFLSTKRELISIPLSDDDFSVDENSRYENRIYF